MELDRDGRTDLHYAAHEGREADVRSALASGQNVNVQDHSGWSPLHFAAQSQQHVIVGLLLDAGGDVDARDRFGKTPLGVALFNVRGGAGTVVRVLIAGGADPDVKNHFGISPRMLADTVANYDLKRFFEPEPTDNREPDSPA